MERSTDTEAVRKWTASPADPPGPRQAKALSHALRSLRSLRSSWVEVLGVKGDPASETRYVVSACFGPGEGGPFPLPGMLEDEIGQAHGWTVARASVRDVTAAVEAATKRAREALPVVDRRREPAEVVAQSARMAAADAERAARNAGDAEAWRAIMAKRPDGAAAVIVAREIVDQSDLMTDYFGSTRGRPHAIGWRTGSREDFRQLRAAAARFPATAHMAETICRASVRGVWDFPPDHRLTDADADAGRVFIRLASDSGTAHYGGQGVPSVWLADAMPDCAVNSWGWPEWTGPGCEAARDAWVAAHPAPLGVKWHPESESCEHREQWSMGGGNFLKAGDKHCNGWEVRSETLPADGRAPSGLSGIVDALPEAEGPGGPGGGRRASGEAVDGVAASGAEWRVVAAQNKRGPFGLVVPAARLEREAFEALRERAKRAGGWYSRAWGRQPGGFGFETVEAAEAWARNVWEEPADPALDIDDGTEPKARGPGESQAESVKADPLAERLERLADAMQAGIDERRAPLSQNPTPRRLRIQDGRRRAADGMEAIQGALRALAAARREGALPPCLAGLTTRKAVSDVMQGWMREDDPRQHARRLLADMIEAGRTPEAEEARLERLRAAEVEAAERALRFQPTPGFFPSPPAVVDRVLELLDLRTGGDGLAILEPSAGIGSLALPLAAHVEARGGTLECVEVSAQCCRVMESKGLLPRCADFLAEPAAPRFDRVAMNPPFERGEDVRHVRHAAAMLRPGGVLVAVMSPRGAEAICAELPGCLIEPLPEGSFAGKDAFRRTAVNAVLVAFVNGPETAP